MIMDRLIIFKPDAVMKGICGEVLKVMPKPKRAFMCRLPVPFWEVHYAHVKDEMAERWQDMIDWLANAAICVVLLPVQDGIDWKTTVRDNFKDDIDGYHNLIHVSDDGKADAEFDTICKFVLSIDCAWYKCGCGRYINMGIMESSDCPFCLETVEELASCPECKSWDLGIDGCFSCNFKMYHGQTDEIRE